MTEGELIERVLDIEAREKRLAERESRLIDRVQEQAILLFLLGRASLNAKARVDIETALGRFDRDDFRPRATLARILAPKPSDTDQKRERP